MIKRTSLLSASLLFALLAAGFVVLFTVMDVWLAIDQHQLLETMRGIQTQTLPATIEQQRLSRNLEVLRLEGDRVLFSPRPEARQQASLIVSLIASHPSILGNIEASKLARDVERFLSSISTERRHDSEVQKEWESLSLRLSLLADDVSIDGVNLATGELKRMESVVQLSRKKLILAMFLGGVFVAGILVLVQRVFIKPLQQINKALAGLRNAGEILHLPASKTLEISEIENAIVLLQTTMKENEEARANLIALASTDVLTGLPNRRSFTNAAHEAVERAHRYHRVVSVGLADLDHFKRINDTYGHEAGDCVLKTFADRVRQTMRQSDLVCRYGGEEFAFVFIETPVAEARCIADRLREEMGNLLIELPNGESESITLSFGLADASSVSLEEALRHADIALYSAKNSGRNQGVIFEGA